MGTGTALFRLRRVMAAPETGAWFTARVLVDESLACTSDFDDEAEPEWEDQLGLSEYPREQQRSRAARRTSPTG